MSKERSAKDSLMAAHLKSKGIYHGKRVTSPAPNSGGLTITKGPGSAAYQRLMKKRHSG